jgi:hypothetical protein
VGKVWFWQPLVQPESEHFSWMREKPLEGAEVGAGGVGGVGGEGGVGPFPEQKFSK